MQKSPGSDSKRRPFPRSQSTCLTRWTSHSKPHGPIHPKCRKIYLGDEWRDQLTAWWKFYMSLVQYWTDATSDHPYGGPIREDSKMMYYIFYRMEVLFKKWNIQTIPLYAMKATTLWGRVGAKGFASNEMTRLRVASEAEQEEMQQLRKWLQKRYQREAKRECETLARHEGDFDQLP